MKQLYTYFPEFDDEDCLLWHVYETNTQQIIESFVFEDDALELAQKLTSGMGFVGFTPSFILRKVNIKKNINEAFSLEFA